jgi:hypothetical protein
VSTRDHRSIWLLLKVVPAGALIATLASWAPAGATPKGAPNAFVLTGAVRGTLVVNTGIDCSAMTPQHASLGWLGAKLKPYPAAAWGIVFNFPRYGTWKKFSFAGAGVMFSASGYGTWFATSGSFTATANAGSVNATLAGHELGAKGTIHLTGRWNCG